MILAVWFLWVFISAHSVDDKLLASAKIGGPYDEAYVCRNTMESEAVFYKLRDTPPGTTYSSYTAAEYGATYGNATWVKTAQGWILRKYECKEELGEVKPKHE